jgi:Nitrile hydratase, alpha chain
MTEATGDDSRAEMERRLIQRSLEDEDFRQRLLAEPRAAIEQEFGSRLPESVEVLAVEETSEIIYLVLPSSSPTGQGGELSDQELEAVAGGEGDIYGEEPDTSFLLVGRYSHVRLSRRPGCAPCPEERTVMLVRGWSGPAEHSLSRLTSENSG